MRGNTFGKLFSLTTFGESHGPYMGVVLDGVKPLLKISVDDLNALLKRRAPGSIVGTTSRVEADVAEIISGVLDGVTTGAPLTVLIKNTNQRSQDYNPEKFEARKGHADRTYELKYGIRDHRGSGRASGRETVSRVIAAYFARLMLPENLMIKAVTKKMGDLEESYGARDFWEAIEHCNEYGFIHHSPKDVGDYLQKLKSSGDSVGGLIELRVKNVPIGLGEPAFDKLKADLAKAMLSMGACVGVSFGLGFEMANLKGSEIEKISNPFGGIEGGISNGEDLILTLAIKPTSTIGKNALEGRHDPCIIPRALVVVESMAINVLCDHYLRQMAYR